MNTEATVIEREGIPKYYQIQEEICGLIGTELQVGDRLPGERKLAEMFKVSHMTARHAVQNLVDSGVLVKQHGKGTFVARLRKERTPVTHKVKAKTVSVVLPAIPKIPNFSGSYIKSGVLEGVYEVMSEVNYQVNINYFNPSEKTSPLQKCLDNEQDGVVFWYTETPRNLMMLKELEEHGVPFVLVNNCSSKPYDYVVTDNLAGTHKMVKHLRAQGSRKIAYVDKDEADTSVVERRAGFLTSTREYGLSESDVFTLPQDCQDAALAECVDQILAGGFEAIFAYNDMTAITIMNILHEKNVKVPDEIRLVGYDNIDLSQFLTPSLTTIHQDFYEMGRVAGQVLLARMTGQAGAGVQGRRNMPTIVIRNSSVTAEK